MIDLRQFVSAWRPGIGEDAVLRHQGADPEALRTRSPAAARTAERAVRDGSELVTPFVMLKEYQVHEQRHERILLSDGGRLSGPLLARYLSGADEIVVGVGSIGSRIESRCAESVREDPPYALALDAFGTLALTSLVSALSDRLCEEVARHGRHITLPLNPGMRGWPVAKGQQQLFGLLDGLGQEVILTTSSYMVPRKSTSFVYGVGHELPGESGSPCECCSLGERCSYRSQYG